MLERKARQGVNYRFWTWLPKPVKATTAVTLAVRAPTPFTSAMTRVGLTATVTSISSDRRTLTLSAPALALNGAVGEKGGYAFIRPDSGPSYQVQIVDQPTLSTLSLAEPLPQAAIITSATLSWEVYQVDVTLATATAVVKRNIPYTITWTSNLGSGVPDETEREEGLLHVVRQPFQTGLTQRELLMIAASLGYQMPQRQESWQPQIDAGLRQLVRWIRKSMPLASLSTVGEDGYNGAAFMDVHAYLVISMILSDQVADGMDKSDARDDYRSQAEAMFKDIMEAPPWLDIDGDGVVDPGEADTKQLSFSNLVGGNMTAYEANGGVRFVRGSNTNW